MLHSGDKIRSTLINSCTGIYIYNHTHIGIEVRYAKTVRRTFNFVLYHAINKVTELVKRFFCHYYYYHSTRFLHATLNLENMEKLELYPVEKNIHKQINCIRVCAYNYKYTIHTYIFFMLLFCTFFYFKWAFSPLSGSGSPLVKLFTALFF